MAIAVGTPGGKALNGFDALDRKPDAAAVPRPGFDQTWTKMQEPGWCPTSVG